MHGDDFEPYRGRWVARSEADDTVVADAASYEELHSILATFDHPRVFVHRVPTADEPLYIGLG